MAKCDRSCGIELIGYVAIHKSQGVVGFAVQTATGVLVHIRHDYDYEEGGVESTEFTEKSLEAAADGLENLMLSYSDFNVYPLFVGYKVPAKPDGCDGEAPDTSTDEAP